MPGRIFALAAILVLAPLGAHAADLVTWWEEGYYAQEDEAVREIIAAFEEKTGKRVELALYPQAEIQERIDAALEVGQPPDFAFGLRLADYVSPWAFDDQLVDLTDTVGSFSNLFGPDALAWWVLLNGKTGQSDLLHSHDPRSLVDDR